MEREFAYTFTQLYNNSKVSNLETLMESNQYLIFTALQPWHFTSTNHFEHKSNPMKPVYAALSPEC